MANDNIAFNKQSRIGGTAFGNTLASWNTSFWLLDGEPSGGATPGAWSNPDNTTVGGLMQSVTTGGKTKYLTCANLLYAGTGRVVLIDRLLQVGGFSGTVTTVQNVNGGADATVSRTYSATDGTTTINHCGNRIFVEIYTAVGSQVTLTVNYKNHAGVAKSSSVLFGGANGNVQGRIVEVPLAAGDLGVSALVSCQLSGSMVTAGNFGLTVGHRLLEFVPTVPSLMSQWYGNILIPSGACLTFYGNTTSNVAGGGLTWLLRGSLIMVEV